LSTCSYGTIGRTQSCALATHFFWHWPMFSSCCLMCSGRIHSAVGDLQPSLFCLQCQRWTWIDSRRLSHQEHWAIVYQNSQTFKFASGFGRVKTKGLPHKLCKFIRRSFWTKLHPSLPPFFHLPPCTEPRIGLEPRQLASVAWGQSWWPSQGLPLTPGPHVGIPVFLFGVMSQVIELVSFQFFSKLFGAKLQVLRFYIGCLLRQGATDSCVEEPGAQTPWQTCHLSNCTDWSAFVFWLTN